MEHEASAAGLRLRPRETGAEWKWEQPAEDEPKESLTKGWWILEWLPIERLSFEDFDSTIRFDMPFLYFPAYFYCFQVPSLGPRPCRIQNAKNTRLSCIQET